MAALSLPAKLGLGIGFVIFTTLAAMGSYHAGPRAIPNTVYVTETDYHLSASRTVFRPGVTYHFVVHNASADLHEFMIGPKFPTMLAMEQMDAMSLAMIEGIMPGQTATVDVRFPATGASAMPGMPMGPSLELSCHLPGHYERGMALSISVAAHESKSCVGSAECCDAIVRMLHYAAAEGFICLLQGAPVLPAIGI
jgi:uncharacterized cupredoxin-like copper-binding protein